MKKNFKLLVLASLLLATKAFAQDDSFTCPKKALFNSKKENEIVRKVQDSYQKVSDFEAQFLQNSYMEALQISEISSGKMYFVKPGKMRWEYEQPTKQLFIANQNTLWLYQPELNQVVVDKFDSFFTSALPVSFLMGIGNLAKDFVTNQLCENSDGILLDLKRNQSKDPNQKKEFEGFKLLVDKKSYIPIGAQIKDIAGNLTSFIFNQVKTNQNTNVAKFEIEVPAGTDTIDKR